MNLSPSYLSLIKNKLWDSILALSEIDNSLSPIERISLRVISFYKLKMYDSVINLIKTSSINPDQLPPELCSYYAFSLYRLNEREGKNAIMNCAKTTKNQHELLKITRFLIQNFEAELAKSVLNTMYTFLTLKYRPYWHYYMAVAHSLTGYRDSAIYHLEQAINYKPDWVKPRIKLVEILPASEISKKKRLLEEIIKLNPSYAPAHYWLSALNRNPTETLIPEILNPELMIHKVRAEMSLGNFYKAKQYLQDLLTIDSTNPYILFLMGNWYLNMDSFRKAISWYTQALKKAHYNYPEAWLNLGVAYRRIGMTDSAIFAYSRALALRKDYWEALYNLGLAYWYSNRVEKAYRTFKRLLQYKPHNPKIWYFLGRVYEKLNHIDSAIMAYKKAIELLPDYRRALIRLAKLDKSTYTLKLLENYLQNNSADSRILKLLGDIYYQQGKISKAKKIYIKALNLDPTNQHILKTLATLYEKEGNINKAIEYWQEVLNINLRDKRARRELATLYLQKHDTLAAIRQIEKLLQLYPDDKHSLSRLIKLYETQNLNTRALQFLLTLWENHAPQTAELAYLIATFARRTGKYDLAIHFYEYSIDSSYKMHWSAYWLGKLLLAQGDTSKAIQYFNYSLKIKPDFFWSWKRLAEIYLAIDSLNLALQAIQTARKPRPHDQDLLQLEQYLKLKMQ